MLARNVPNGRLAPDLSKVGKLGFAERFGGGLISLFFHCPPPYILKAARPRAMLARNLRPIHRTPKRKRQPGMGHPRALPEPWLRAPLRRAPGPPALPGPDVGAGDADAPGAAAAIRRTWRSDALRAIGQGSRTLC